MAVGLEQIQKICEQHHVNPMYLLFGCLPVMVDLSKKNQHYNPKSLCIPIQFNTESQYQLFKQWSDNLIDNPNDNPFEKVVPLNLIAEAEEKYPEGSTAGELVIRIQMPGGSEKLQPVDLKALAKLLGIPHLQDQLQVLIDLIKQEKKK